MACKQLNYHNEAKRGDTAMISKKLLVFAIILSLLTAGSVYYYLQNLEKSLNTTEYVNIFTASKDIPANTKITGEMFIKKQIPVEYAHNDSVIDIEKVKGKIIKVPLVAGEVILKSHLAGEKGGDGLAYTVPVGKRAITISVSEVSAVANMVLPGDRVDIIVTLDMEEKKADQSKEKVTKNGFLLQKLEILAVGSRMERNSKVKAKEITTVTLAVSPEEAPRLALASERGTIRMLLRSPIDDEIKDLTPVRLQDLLERR